MFPALCSGPILAFLMTIGVNNKFQNPPRGNGHNSLTIRHTDLCLLPNESSHQALPNHAHHVHSGHDGIVGVKHKHQKNLTDGPLNKQNK